MMYKKLIINGQEFPLAVNQSGWGAPTSKFTGEPGMLYMDTGTKVFYKCTDAYNGNYTWEELGVAKDGGYYIPKVIGRGREIQFIFDPSDPETMLSYVYSVEIPTNNILTSPNGTRWILSVDDSGNVRTEKE